MTVPALPKPALREMLATAALFAIAAFALRWSQFGNPLAGLDEQFYLLVGDRIWQGALPYVDLWDRKPAGLFLLYAAIRLLPGDGILAYQIVNTLFLAATGWVIARIARRTLPLEPALLAGLAAIGYGVLIGAGFGEAPIFYDLLTALSAWCLLALRDAPAHARWRGAVAMLLCGLALTIKTVAVFESIAFGLILLATYRGEPWPKLLRRAVGYGVIGLAPTLVILLFYAARGDFATFWFANVESIALRTGGTNHESLLRLVAALILVSPLAILAIVGGRPGSDTRDRPVLLLWLAACAVGFCAVGYFLFHYALPMVTPLALLAAYALRPRWLARGVLGLAALGIGIAATGSSDGTRRDQRAVAALLQALPSDVATHCLLVTEGPAILYHLSHACLVTRYAFPGHLAAPDEAKALGRPRDAILRDALARHPAAIVASAVTTDPILTAVLARDYSPSAPVRVRLYGATGADIVVWRRNPAPRGLVRKLSNTPPYHSGSSMRKIAA